MSDQPPEATTQSAETQLISMEQMEQMFQLFQKLHKNTNLPETGIPQTVRVAEKLNFTNYTKWCKLMHIAIGGRGRLNHITANPVPPNDPEYQQWAQKDSTVLSWIIENIDGDLVNQFLDYKTARELWKGIENLLSSGRDELQIYDLSTKAATMRQGKDTIEVYFSKINTLWKEIDRRMPNPMKCAEDITLFNSFIQRQRLYQFLAGVSDTLDKEKRDILYQDPLPTLDAAYASIRREIARRGIMASDSSLGRDSSEIGSGLLVKRRPESSSFRREDKTQLKCSHCGGTKHTKEGCFKIIGYPEWWGDLKQRKIASKDGKANLAVGDPDGNNNIPLTTALHSDQAAGTVRESEVTGNQNSLGLLCNQISNPWIFDCGATDTMTYDSSDIVSSKNTHRTQIQTANGEYIPITQAGTVDVTSNIHLQNCLLIPNLTHKLLSVSQLTRELNCTILMTSSGCVVQDAQMGRIIGHGTERGGLYYVNEVTQNGNALLVHGSPEHQLWMWHRRLGHPSIGYLKRLFPSLKNIDVDLNCEACVLAKSHKHSYYPSVTHSTQPFALIHSDVWGPAPDFTFHNFSYFVLFVDDCTRMSWVFFLKHKSEMFDVFVKFYHMICTHFRAQPKILRSDNGGNTLI